MHRRVGWWSALGMSIAVLMVIPQNAEAVAAARQAPHAVPTSRVAEATEDGGSESIQAARTGEPVVVDDWTTETTEIEALPTGGFKATISAEPVRVKDGDGSADWVDLDSTLERRSDGMLEPVATIGDVVLSGGGPVGSTLAAMSSGGVSYEVRTPFALPVPTLHGDTAVYSNVLPDVDLVTTATSGGFTFNWVVKSREAADDPRVRTLRLPVDLDGLTPRAENGGFSYVDEAGVRQFWTPTPTMWDSSGAPSADPEAGTSDETALSSVDEGPDMADRVTAVAASVNSSQMTLTPDTSLLDADDVVFPVVIDPGVNKARNGWTAVWNNFPNKSFWQTEHSLGAGYEGYEQFKVVRSYFRFDTSAIRGKRILGAELNVRQIHAASCSARPTDAYRTATIGTGTTWNAQPARYDLQSSSSSTAGCGTGTKMVGWDIAAGAADLAAANASSGTFMLRARDEGDKIAWKQFDDDEANIEVTYVSRPATPSAVTLRTANGTSPCGTATTPTMIGSTSVTLGVKMTSADEDSATVSLQGIFRRRDMALTDDYSDSAGTSGVSGATSTLTWNVQNGHLYRFRAKVRASWTYNGVPGAWDSGFNDTWCYFKVDTTSPPPPRITASSFLECASVEAPEDCKAQGQAGTPGTFTVATDATDAVSYRWTLNGSAATTVATSAGAARTITVTPTDTMNTFTVWSVDGAGNLSLKEIYNFKVEPRQAEVQWSFDSTSMGADTGREQDAPLDTGSAVVAPRGRIGKALSFTGGTPARSFTGDTSTGVPSDNGVSATSAFTVGAWVRIDTPAQGSTTTLLSANYSAGNVFEFGYEPTTNKWTAGRRRTGSVSLASSSTAALKVWTHLAATYDPGTLTLTFYVNGRSAGTIVYPSAAWLNGYGWRVGCGRIDNTESSCGVGQIDEVNLYNSILGPEEIQDLADPATEETPQPITAPAAAWSMNDADDAAVAADSCCGADLGLANVPSPRFGVTQDGANRALVLTGDPAQQAKATRPLVDATGSFTIAVSVRPSVAGSMVVAQQRGANRESWTLAFEHDTDAENGRWVFQRTTADSSAATIVEVRSPVVVDPELTSKVTVLVGTYDRKRDRIALYVNGADFTQGPDPATQEIHQTSFGTPWPARGDFLIGSGTLNGLPAPFAGEVERVDLFTGAFALKAANAYYDAARPLL